MDALDAEFVTLRKELDGEEVLLAEAVADIK